MEFTVIKIIDGILIGDILVTSDYEFLENNKISHAIGWLAADQFASPQLLNDVGVKAVNITRNNSEVPTLKQVETCIQAITESKDEHLCCLIYGQEIYDSLFLLCPYFVCRYGWSIQSSISFIQKRLALMNIPNLQEHLNILRQKMGKVLAKMLKSNRNKLKQIKWEFSFLKQYQSDDFEELLLINTVKNTLISEQTNQMQEKMKTNKYKKRITWFDQAAKNTVTAGQRLFANSKISSSLKKSSSVKSLEQRPSLKLTNMDNIFISNSINNYVDNQPQSISINSNMVKSFTPNPLVKQVSQGRAGSAKKMSQTLKQNEFDDLDYLSLKELSRTNFNDMKYGTSTGFYKQRSLKNYKRLSKTSQLNKAKGGKKQKDFNCINIANKSLAFLQGIKGLDAINNSIRA